MTTPSDLPPTTTPLPDGRPAGPPSWTGGTAAGPDLAGAPAAGADPAVLVRHEERLRVGVDTVVSTRVRVRKHLVTEQQTITVPVTREVVTVEELPPVPGAPGGPGAGLTEDVVEIIRHEERIVVTTEVVPVERIRLVRSVVTTEQVVGAPVRREILHVDDPTGR